MCVQCMFAAVTSGAAATGARSWLGTRRWAWLTPLRLKRLTIALLALALVAAATLFGGSSHPAG